MQVGVFTEKCRSHFNLRYELDSEERRGGAT
jgi:hypothetical protein